MNADRWCIEHGTYAVACCGGQDLSTDTAQTVVILDRLVIDHLVALIDGRLGVAR